MYEKDLESCNMEVDYCNGFTFNGILVPEDILIHILSYLDVSQLLKYRLVCKQWNDTITSNSLWCSMYNRKYHKSPKALPWHLYYHLFSDFFNENLLKNVNGEKQFTHWKIKNNGGDKFKVENVPLGCNPLPDKVPEFKNNTSCFATSYDLCSKTQKICFKGNKLDLVRKYKPHIYVSEWVAPRFDCGCRYLSKLTVVCNDRKRIDVGRLEHEAPQWAEPKWIKLETVITDYPDNIEHLEFTHSGKDTKFWAGHYGVKMAGAMVKLLFESIPSDEDA